MENQNELKNELMYIHVGVGSPHVRSYTLSLCKSFTSTCLHKPSIRTNIESYTASVVDYVFRKFMNTLNELRNPFHMYKSFDRTYIVYKSSYELYSLIKQIFYLAMLINGNKFLRDKKKIIVNSIVEKCKDVNMCIDMIIDTVNKLEYEIRKRRERGKKALLSRFENNTRKCKHIIDKYFSDFENAPTFKVSGIGFSECFEDAVKILKKMFPEDIATRYANSICAGGNSIYLFARDSIIAIDARYDNHDVKIFCDSCVDNEKYAVVKLVGVKLFDNEIYRVDWIAVLGYDKHTNQIFLHYVPKTLIFRDVETCRKWILGLVDNRGNPTEDVEIVEV